MTNRSTDASDLILPGLAGRYAIDRELGRGGMATGRRRTAEISRRLHAGRSPR